MVTDNDNKDPQIMAEMVQKWLETFSSYEDMYDGTIDAADIARAYLKQAAELKQLKGEAASMDIVVIENKAYMPWPKHMGIRGNLANRIGELEVELKQLRAERAAEVTMNYLLKIVGDANVEAGGLITWEQGFKAIRKHCQIFHKSKLTDSAQSSVTKEG